MSIAAYALAVAFLFGACMPGAPWPLLLTIALVLTAASVGIAWRAAR